MKPYILLTPRNQSTNSDNRIMSDNESYFDFIAKAGGIPVLCGLINEEDADEYAARFDGLLITGGEDVSPSLYHQEPHGAGTPSPDYDRNDLLLYHAFCRADKPVLGICRGIQLIGAAEGVSLIQDLPSANYAQHEQKKMVPPLGTYDYAHEVLFEEGTSLYDIFGPQARVNSFHHQAVTQVPEGFKLAAVSKEDHVIEAFENENVLAVQWHPERLINDPKHFEIAYRFVGSCLLGKTR